MGYKATAPTKVRAALHARKTVHLQEGSRKMVESQLRRKQTFQNIAWFLDLKNRDHLNMDPPYQRWSVWNLEYKQTFIETLLLAYPSPAIFLFRRVDEAGKTLYNVVDGKQRLMAIFEFIENVFPMREKTPLKALAGKYFESLDKDIKIAFFDYDLSVEYLPTNNETVIDDIFDRLNRNVARLTAQELRHAKYNGDFINVTEKLANWTWGIVGTPEDDDAIDSEIARPQLPSYLPRVGAQVRRQMKDVEIVAGLLLYLEEGVKGYKAQALDEAFSSREEWERGEAYEEEYRNVISTIKSMVSMPSGAFLLQSRLRNQADFYSFFGAVANLLRERWAPSEESLERLREFFEMVESEDLTKHPAFVAKYYDAARSASSDPGSRATRINTVTKVLRGENPDENGA